MKKIRKIILMLFEVAWITIWALFLLFKGVDYVFDTQIISSIKSNRILSAFFDSDDEIQWVPVDLDDPYFVQIQKNMNQIMPAESVQSIKVNQNNENQKTFLIQSKDWVEEIVLVLFSGWTYILSHLVSW